MSNRNALDKLNSLDAISTQGSELLERCSRNHWSHRGDVDPGMILLQAIAYSVADVLYRHRVDIKNIFTPQSGENKNIYGDFTKVRDMLRYVPITIDDYRREILSLYDDKTKRFYFRRVDIRKSDDSKVLDVDYAMDTCWLGELQNVRKNAEACIRRLLTRYGAFSDDQLNIQAYSTMRNMLNPTAKLYLKPNVDPQKVVGNLWVALEYVLCHRVRRTFDGVSAGDRPSLVSEFLENNHIKYLPPNSSGRIYFSDIDAVLRSVEGLENFEFKLNEVGYLHHGAGFIDGMKLDLVFWPFSFNFREVANENIVQHLEVYDSNGSPVSVDVGRLWTFLGEFAKFIEPENMQLPPISGKSVKLDKNIDFGNYIPSFFIFDERVENKQLKDFIGVFNGEMNNCCKRLVDAKEALDFYNVSKKNNFLNDVVLNHMLECFNVNVDCFDNYKKDGDRKNAKMGYLNEIDSINRGRGFEELGKRSSLHKRISMRLGMGEHFGEFESGDNIKFYIFPLNDLVEMAGLPEYNSDDEQSKLRTPGIALEADSFEKSVDPNFRYQVKKEIIIDDSRVVSRFKVGDKIKISNESRHLHNGYKSEGVVERVIVESKKIIVKWPFSEDLKESKSDTALMTDSIDDDKRYIRSYKYPVASEYSSEMGFVFSSDFYSDLASKAAVEEVVRSELPVHLKMNILTLDEKSSFEKISGYYKDLISASSSKAAARHLLSDFHIIESVR